MTETLTVGDLAPNVRLRDHGGVELELASLWKERPVALFFLRHLG